MDVATIATTAAAAGQVEKLALNASNGLLLHSKSLDESLRNLQNEVKTLGDACKALQTLLNGFLRSRILFTEGEDEHFFIRIQRSMNEYESTIEPIDRCVRSVDKAKSSLFRKSKFNLKSEEVVRMRQRTESHLLSVQLTTKFLNLRNSLLSTDEIDLVALRASISETQRRRARLQAISQVNSPYLGQDQKLCESTAALIADTDHILSRASLFYEDGINRRSADYRSHVGSSASSMTQSPQQRFTKQFEVASSKGTSTNTSQLAQNDAADRQESITVQSLTSNLSSSRIQSPIYQESVDSQSVASLRLFPQPPRSNTSPSLASYDPQNKPNAFGHHDGVTTPGKVNSVSQWIDGLSDAEKTRPATISNKPPASLISDLSSSTMPSRSLSGLSGVEQLTSNRTSLTHPSVSASSYPLGGLVGSEARQSVKHEPAVVDESDEDDIGVELAKNVIATGMSALEKENYGVARGYLLEGLSLIQQLPLKLQAAACDMLEVRYGLAMCSIALDSQFEQEKAMLEVLQQNPNSDAQREKLFRLSHILAQLYITTARLTFARQSCDKALRGRRKLLGKEHNDYFASLALMARICELENARIQAQGYMDMIPELERKNHDFRHLRIETHSEKEAVELADTGSASQLYESTVGVFTSHHQDAHAGSTKTAQHDLTLDPTFRASATPTSIQQNSIAPESTTHHPASYADSTKTTQHDLSPDASFRASRMPTSHPQILTPGTTTSHHPISYAGPSSTAQHDPPLDSSFRISVFQRSTLDLELTDPTAKPISRKSVGEATVPDGASSAKNIMTYPALRHADLAGMSDFNPTPIIMHSPSSHASSSAHGPPSVARVQSYVDVPLPNPGNDYLGFCKAACQLQNGDRKATKKAKEYNNLTTPVYWLRCSAAKCDFATEIDLSLIWTWTKVWRLKESHGIAYRWAFLVKSHVRQTKMKPHQAMYKCLFCVFLGHHAPVIQGTDLYFDHIAQKHRGSDISQVVLYKTNCVTDRVCTDEEEFDINLYPKSGWEGKGG